MWTKLTIALACGGMLTASTGCAQAPDEQPPVGAARKPVLREHASTSDVVPAEPGPKPQPPSSGDDLLNRMAQDLAGRLGAKKSELQVLAVESVVWNDGALGCPQPGRSYLTAQVPGIRVLFQRGGKTYQYHGSERGDFVHCPNPAVPAGGYDRQ